MGSSNQAVDKQCPLFVPLVCWEASNLGRQLRSKLPAYLSRVMKLFRSAGNPFRMPLCILLSMETDLEQHFKPDIFARKLPPTSAERTKNSLKEWDLIHPPFHYEQLSETTRWIYKPHSEPQTNSSWPVCRALKRKQGEAANQMWLFIYHLNVLQWPGISTSSAIQSFANQFIGQVIRLVMLACITVFTRPSVHPAMHCLGSLSPKKNNFLDNNRALLLSCQEIITPAE